MFRMWWLVSLCQNLHRGYQQPSYCCTDLLFLSHWHNHSDRAGTPESNRQVERVFLSAVKKKNNQGSHMGSIHKKLFYWKYPQCLCFGFICVVRVCLDRRNERMQWSEELPAAAVHQQRPRARLKSTHVHMCSPIARRHTHRHLHRKHKDMTHLCVLLHHHFRRRSQDHVEIQDSADCSVG